MTKIWFIRINDIKLNKFFYICFELNSFELEDGKGWSLNNKKNAKGFPKNSIWMNWGKYKKELTNIKDKVNKCSNFMH